MEVILGTFNSNEAVRYVVNEDRTLEYKEAPVLSFAPTWMVHHSNGLLYANSEVRDFKGAKSGSIGVFSIDSENESIKVLNEVASGGEGPTHFAIHDDLLACSNYDGGSLSVHRLDNINGTFTGKYQVLIYDKTSAVNRDGCHAHQCIFSTKGDLLTVLDLGTDCIYQHRVFPKCDRGDDTFVDAMCHKVALPKGSGPRHLVFHPSNRFALVVNEISNTLMALPVDRETNLLSYSEDISSISTLHGELLPRVVSEEFAGSQPSKVVMNAAEVFVSEDGKFCYVSNRDVTEGVVEETNNSNIAVFRVDCEMPNNDENLSIRVHISFLQSIPVGIHPRHFVLLPWPRGGNAQSHLLVGNQRSGSVTSFLVDTMTGMIDEKSAVTTRVKHNPAFVLALT